MSVIIFGWPPLIKILGSTTGCGGAGDNPWDGYGEEEIDFRLSLTFYLDFRLSLTFALQSVRYRG